MSSIWAGIVSTKKWLVPSNDFSLYDHVLDTAAMLGAVPIIIDPIFSGLAWSLIFGLFASTLFTLFVIPITYWLLYANKPGHGLPQSTMDQEEK